MKIDNYVKTDNNNNITQKQKETSISDTSGNGEKTEENPEQPDESAVTVDISDQFKAKQEEAERLKKAFIKMAEDSKKAARKEDEKVALNYKLKILRNMLKTIQLFQSTSYTKESFRGLMFAAKRAAAVTRSGDPSISKVNRALIDLRAGMSKLKAARYRDKKGRMESIGNLGTDKDELAIKLGCNDPDSLTSVKTVVLTKDML